MMEFLKEWRGVIALALALLCILLVAAGVVMPYVEEKREICHQKAQKFDPPPASRWNPSGWGDGCELSIDGKWYPAGLLRPSLEP